MNDLQKIIRDLRNRANRRDKRNLISVWSEKERFKNKIVDSLVIILRTKGCRWAYHSGCSMCGYFNDTNTKIKEEDLINQINEAREKYNGEKVIKIFTSGSFLDDWEVPPKVREYAYDVFKNADRIIVESRPEFVTEEKAKIMSNKGNIMVALGLESANNETLLHRINKGFTIEDYIKAAKILMEQDVPIKTYILLKPPFMTERQAIEEAVYSVEFACRYSEIVSVNPMNIQNYTLVEYLWRRGEYRAPWLWSVVEVLKRTYNVDADVISFPTAGGKVRGAHNCGKCDERVLKAIEDFSLTQDIKFLENLNCDCIERWKKIVNYEDYLWDYSINA